MKFISTNKTSAPVSFPEAVLQGLADDRGLYMPDTIPKINSDFWSGQSFAEIAATMIRPYVSGFLDEDQVSNLIEDAFNFEVPLVPLDDNTYVMELFHGPTLAFKDFGARFMARVFEALPHERNITILVATSGDTGSAVAQGFKGVKGVTVYLLYPSGKVSHLQEQQLTTTGENVTALEVDGTFDDCQRIVKQAFSDPELRNRMTLSSANSINIARLIPQSFYYVFAVSQFKALHDTIPVISVPSGNMGNLTGGLLAKRMGLPIKQFIVATNANDVVPEYLENGIFTPRPSVRTLSNAMDVGDPSNLARIRYLFNDSIDQIRSILWGASFTDEETKRAIKEVYRRFHYVVDPHTAVGYLASEAYREYKKQSDLPVIIMSTAHPAKFIDTVEPLIGEKISIPERLRVCLDKEKQSVQMSTSYDDLKSYLLEHQ